MPKGVYKRKLKRVETECTVCGKIRSWFASVAKRRRYCSLQCAGKGKKSEIGNITCTLCGKPFYRKPSQIAFIDGCYCSKQCFFKDKVGRRVGEGSPKWKGDNIGYSAVHRWVNKWFGKANRCEKCGATEAKRFEWAKLKGKEYERKRENFWMLCVTCHKHYDGTLWGHKSYETWDKGLKRLNY